MGHRLDALFKPSSVAIVVGSPEQGLLCKTLIGNVTQSAFRGKLLTVEDISEVSDSLDLAIICNPDGEAIEKCIKKHVRAVVAMVSEETAVHGSKWSTLVQRAGSETILIGPDSIGISNSDTKIALNASLVSHQSSDGNVALITQSGTLGRSLLEYGEKAGIGFSLFASVGDAPNCSLTDMLEFCEQNDQTKVILLHTSTIIGMGNFAETVARVSKTKPIVMLRSGRAKVLKSANLESGTTIEYELNIDEMLDQCGVHRTVTVDEFFTVAKALTYCSLPKNRQVGVITNDGGCAAVIRDVLIANNLEVVKENDFTLPLIPGIDDFESALSKAVRDDQVDIVLASVISPAPNALKISDLETETKSKPVLGVFDSGVEVAGIPNFKFPDTAVRAAMALIRQMQVETERSSEAEELAVTKEIAQSVIDGVIAENRKEPTFPEAMMVLDAYGINVPRYSYAKDLEEALTAAHGIGYPISMRLLSKDLLHKPDIGSIFAEVKDADDLTSDFLTLISRAQRHQLTLDGILIQETAGAGELVNVYIFDDSEFGKMILVNTEGTADANPQISIATPLTGFQKNDAGDSNLTEAVDEVLNEMAARLLQLTSDFPVISNISIRRLMVSHQPPIGTVTDAHIVLK